jgi:hypothetical protein
MNLPTFLGDKKAVKTMSPMPFRVSGQGWWITGTMVRVIRFQQSFNLKGTTG